MINLCFSESTKGSLKYAFRSRGEQTACLPLLLFRGDLSSVLELETRRNCYRSLSPDFEDSVKLHLEEFQMLLKKDKDVRIWYSSKEPDEYCGFLHSVYLLETCNLTAVDCCRDVEKGNCVTRYRHSGEVSEEVLIDFLQYEYPLKGPEAETLRKTYEKLAAENAPLRVIEENEVISVGEDYYDETIRRHFTKEKRSVARIIGEVIGCEGIFWDSLIAERIKFFIEKGILTVVTQQEEFYRCVVKLQ